MSDLSLHPSTRILLWVFLAAFAFAAGIRGLFWMSLAISAYLALQGAGIFFKLLRRVKWILISLLAIYSFETPGSPLFSGMDAPTLEGLASGATQTWRIAITIALLAILQGSTGREEMLSGIYTLLLPLKRWIDAERIAVRLLLTLHYAEEARPGNWRERIRDAFENTDAPRSTLRLPLYRFRVQDGAVFLAIAAVLAL